MKGMTIRHNVGASWRSLTEGSSANPHYEVQQPSVYASRMNSFLRDGLALAIQSAGISCVYRCGGPASLKMSILKIR